MRSKKEADQDKTTDTKRAQKHKHSTQKNTQIMRRKDAHSSRKTRADASTGTRANPLAHKHPCVQTPYTQGLDIHKKA
jgi:hypothetical protein